MTCRVSEQQQRSRDLECGKETRSPNARLRGCRLLTQIALLFLLSGFASVLFLFALLHSRVIAFFIFMCLDTNWQMHIEPGSCCLSWCPWSRKSKCKESCAFAFSRPPKCCGYETKLAEVKSNLYQTSQKRLHFIKKLIV